MSIAAKRIVSGAVCVFCVLFILLCLSRMVTYGLGGEIGKVKLYFALVAGNFIVGLPFAMAYYYYRGRDHENADLARTRLEVETLSRAGQRRAKS
jgi:hypothetical protein